ncbi:TonB C-terminal domain-containing protein [Microbacteriaceae bacterium K1510]|nr:TonB C-terminal domain-containing protein [Microbacteriaceae bacterium K1510]
MTAPGIAMPWRSIGRGRLSALFCMGLLCAIFLISATMAQEKSAGRSTATAFDIPAQSLATALQVYSEQSGVHVIYESGSSVGRQSSPVKGDYTREDALKTLLGANDLIVRYARADSVILLNPAEAQRDEPPELQHTSADIALETLHVTKPQNEPDPTALADYIGVIQQDVQQALRKRGKASSGSYRVGLELWVDPSRTIQKTQVFRSTGDRDRDLAVAEALQGVVIRQPAPAHTPQPVRVMIVVRSL